MRRVIKNSLPSLAALAALLLLYGSHSTASAASSGVVTITFDDGSASQYTDVVPVLKAADQKAVFFLNSGFLGTATYMTWDQVVELHNSGFEIAGHTLKHTELPTVTQSKMKSEINKDYANFVAHGITPTNFASPFGAYDNTMLSLVAKTYNSHRAFANQGLNFWPYTKYILNVRYITNQTSLDQVK